MSQSIRITIEIPRTATHSGVNMKKLFITAALVFASQFAFAQAAAPTGDCEAKAIGKNGKPLAGAAKTTFMKKCMADAGAATATPAAAAGTADCEAKAIGKNGKPLAGAAKTTFMKKCTADAGAATAAPAAAGASGCEEKAVSKSGKPLVGAAKDAFIKKCEKDAAAGK